MLPVVCCEASISIVYIEMMQVQPHTRFLALSLRIRLRSSLAASWRRVAMNERKEKEIIRFTYLFHDLGDIGDALVELCLCSLDCQLVQLCDSKG